MAPAELSHGPQRRSHKCGAWGGVFHFHAKTNQPRGPGSRSLVTTATDVASRTDSSWWTIGLFSPGMRTGVVRAPAPWQGGSPDSCALMGVIPPKFRNRHQNQRLKRTCSLVFGLGEPGRSTLRCLQPGILLGSGYQLFFKVGLLTSNQGTRGSKPSAQFSLAVAQIDVLARAGRA